MAYMAVQQQGLKRFSGPKNIKPSAVWATMTVPTNELFSTSITLPSIQPGRLVKSGDIFTVSPFFILQFKVCLWLQRYELFRIRQKKFPTVMLAHGRQRESTCCASQKVVSVVSVVVKIKVAAKKKREARACVSLGDCRCRPLRFTRPWGLRPRRRERRPREPRPQVLRRRGRFRPSWRGHGGWL